MAGEKPSRFVALEVKWCGSKGAEVLFVDSETVGRGGVVQYLRPLRRPLDQTAHT